MTEQTKPNQYVRPATRNRRMWEVFASGDLCLITVDMDTGQVLVEGSYGPYAHRFHTEDILKFLSELIEEQYLKEKFVGYDESRGRNKTSRATGFEWWFKNIWMQFVKYLEQELRDRNASEGK